MMNRRSFLRRSAAAALLAATRSLPADPLGLPIGCQTYPVRKTINTDFAGTMKGLRAAGFTQIELCSPYGYNDFSSLQQYKPQELRRTLNDWGIGCISAHWAANELFEKADESIAYAHDFGMTQMAVAALGPFRPRAPRPSTTSSASSNPSTPSPKRPTPQASSLCCTTRASSPLISTARRSTTCSSPS